MLYQSVVKTAQLCSSLLFWIFFDFERWRLCCSRKRNWLCMPWLSLLNSWRKPCFDSCFWSAIQRLNKIDWCFCLNHTCYDGHDHMGDYDSCFEWVQYNFERLRVPNRLCNLWRQELKNYCWMSDWPAELPHKWFSQGLKFRFRLKQNETDSSSHNTLSALSHSSRATRALPDPCNWREKHVQYETVAIGCLSTALCRGLHLPKVSLCFHKSILDYFGHSIQ